MIKEDEEIIQLKYADKNIYGHISSILLAFFVIVSFYLSFNNLESNYDWINKFLQSNFTKILVIICLIICIIISICYILFDSFFDYHINIKTKNIHFIHGRWKFKTERIVNFKQIKNVVLVQNIERTSDSGETYTYKIDIYDTELNAYGVYLYIILHMKLP